MNTTEKIKALLQKDGRVTLTATPVTEIAYPADDFRGFQGGCTDGKRYYYQTVMRYDHPTRQRDCCRIAKVDMQTGAVVKWSETLYLDHANDMTYHPASGCLFVCHNKPRRERISFVDANTLQLIGSYDLPFPIYSIAYNAVSDTFTAGLSGKREFCFLNSDLAPTEDRTYRTDPQTDRHVKQGICTDGELLYFILWDGKHKNEPDFQNTVAVYDWSGAYRGRLDFNIGVQEPESIDVIDGRLFAVCGHTNPIIYEFKVMQ